MNTHTSPVERVDAAHVQAVEPLLDLTHFSLAALGCCDDVEFERAAADVLRQINRQDSSVAGHNS